MEVVIPIHTMDFDFNTARSSSMDLSAPSSPKRFGEFYCSAPSSPTRLSQFYREFDEFLIANDENISKTGNFSSAAVPFAWEEKPGKPKSSKAVGTKDDQDDFAFNIGDDFAFDIGDDFDETASLSAEELFDGGVIKPLKPPPRLQLPSVAKSGGASSSLSLSSSTPPKLVIFSPRHKKEPDPFSPSPQKTTQRSPAQERGRERGPSGLKSSSRRATRSLSPLRVSQYPWEEEQSFQQQNKIEPSSSNSIIPKPAANSASFLKGYKKWRLKDFFLFRSASEGRAADKDPLKKYTAAFRRYEDVKSSSMRSIESHSGSVSSRRRSPVSAHELHYTINKAVSEDLKKKTFLPYKQGILGRLAFNPAVHAVANGFGLSHK
ncbi:hypothetical protein ACH5RR_035054 [Cinchona calisaya]|uniref:Calmodulin-binding protein n=1 Tax=Cinchona calisaya TaxID=153742 RepID=A0ABD2YCQ3_9GENT